MTPAEVAARLCAERGGNFRDELEAHLLTGYVFSTPTLFLIGKPVPRSVDTAEDIWRRFDIAECNAWFVWLGVGDPLALLNLMPFPLPWIGWHRQGRQWEDVHWLETERLRKKLAGSSQH